MLHAFLSDLARTGFRWGEQDCALILASWWSVNHGFDPAAHLRGTYDTKEGCMDVLLREGGLLRLVARLARTAGARRTRDPKPGDFGVVRIGNQHLCAVLGPTGRWMMLSEAGLCGVSETRVVAAWSIQK